MSEPLDVSEIEFRYFNLANDPANRAGYVNQTYHATESELAAAGEKLHRRHRTFGWRDAPLSAAECDAVAWRADGEAKPPTVGLTPDERSGAEPIVWRPLPFYAGAKLIHLPMVAGRDRAERLVVRATGDGFDCRRLTGSSGVIHELNKAVPLDLDGEYMAEEYLSFFCDHLSNTGGTFTLIEYDDPPETLPHTELYPTIRQFRSPGVDPDQPRPELSRRDVAYAQPITRLDRDGEDIELIAAVYYFREPFRAAFRVSPRGRVDMLEDRPIRGVIFRRPELYWLPLSSGDGKSA